MAIRTVKPTSPALRYLTYVTYDEITKTEPEKSLLAPKRRTNGRNVYGRITVRRRGEADASSGRLPAREVRDPSARGRDRVRSEPLGAPGPPVLQGRREALYHRAARPARRGHRDGWAASGHPAGQRAASAEHPGRHPRAQRRAPARARRAALPERRHAGAAAGEGRRSCDAQAALGRGAAGGAHVHGDHRAGR